MALLCVAEREGLMFLTIVLAGAAARPDTQTEGWVDAELPNVNDQT